uniref:Uncharacterized protein n=1 Tax=Leersia perrieri TaxID=77586 RepID=A0A0D9XYN4_9ORYZ
MEQTPLVYQLFQPEMLPWTFSILAMLIPLLLLVLHYLATNNNRSTSTSCTQTRNHHPLPQPSPPRLPIIGHLHLIGDLPHVSLRELADRHGPDLMLLRLGQVPNLIVSSPRAAEAILRTHDHVFASRPRSMIAEVLAYGPLDVGFAPYGELWRQNRRLVMTHLLTNKKVRSYRAAREEEVQFVMAKVHKLSAKGVAVDMSELLNSFSNDLICRVVSGKSFEGERRNKLFRELFRTNSLLLGGFHLEDCYPGLARLNVLSRMMCVGARNVRKRWDELLDKIIDNHISEQQCENHNEKDEMDFIDVLLPFQEEWGITREHIKALLVDMFAAGTDTGSMVLVFAMAELMQKQNRHLMAKLQAELRMNIPNGQGLITEDHLTNMIYIKAVIKETLRLHPPAPLLLPHLSVADCNLEGYTIHAGTRVIINAWAIGRNSEYWEAAEEFMPERFLDGGSAANIDFAGKDFQFLPFGAGRRICPGINFAVASMEIMLANLLYHFDWEVPAEVAVRKEGINMAEVFGVTVQLKEKLLLMPKICDVINPACT